MITHLLFDLDDTLYSVRYGLDTITSRRIEIYLSVLLNISVDEVKDIRSNIFKNYGTTLEWMIAEKKFSDIDGYFAAVHPEDEADSLMSDPGLRDFLRSIPLPKAILTNSPLEHAERILEKLEIRQEFTHVFDIRHNNFIGKPHKEAFSRALDAMTAEPETTLFVDDSPPYIAGFLAMGGKALLLDELDQHAKTGYQRIKYIHEIKKYL